MALHSLSVATLTIHNTLECGTSKEGTEISQALAYREVGRENSDLYSCTPEALNLVQYS